MSLFSTVKVTLVDWPGVKTTRSRSRSNKTEESADTMPTSGPQEAMNKMTQATSEPRRITRWTVTFAMKSSRK